MNIRHSKKFDVAYMKIAEIISELSYCQRNKVGAIFVSDHRILAEGYNGTPSGFENCCEDSDFKLTGVSLMEDGSAAMEGNMKFITRPEVLHAESNALMKIAKSTNSSISATLYTTLSPCVECAKLLIQAGIERVVYKVLYRDDSGVVLLRKARIIVQSIEDCINSFEKGEKVRIKYPEENEIGVYEILKFSDINSNFAELAFSHNPTSTIVQQKKHLSYEVNQLEHIQ